MWLIDLLKRAPAFRGMRIVLAIVAAMSFASSVAHALDPARSIGQYRRVPWREANGAPPVSAIAQTPDGFLWISGGDGLFRFDGASFEKIAVGGRAQGLTSEVVELLVARDGGLIMGFAGGGIGQWKDGRFTAMPHSKVRSSVMAMAEDRDGAIWVAQTSKDVRLARYRNGQWDIADKTWGAPEGLIISLLVDRRGDLWAAGDGALYRLARGARRFQPIRVEIGTGPGLIEDAAGDLLISDSLGVRRMNTKSLAVDQTSLRRIGQKTRLNRVLFDRDGNLWGGTVGSGVFRIRADMPQARAAAADSKTEETFTAENGLGADTIWSLFEDREGSIWVASGGGLDQFTPAAIAVQEGVQRYPAWDYGLFRLRDGAVYISDDQTMYRALPGETLKPWRPRLDFICDGSPGVQWAADETKLYRLENGRQTVVPMPKGITSPVYCKSDPSGRLWIPAISEGIASFDGKTWRHFDEPDGKWLTAAGNAPDGSVLASGGLRVFRGGLDKLIPLGAPKAPDLSRISAIASDDGAVIAGARYGMLRFKTWQAQGPAQLLSVEKYPWANDVFSLASPPGGITWLLSKPGLVSVPTAQLRRAFDGGTPAVDARVFDHRDGLIGPARSKGGDKLVVGGDGRVWFATSAMVGMIDPLRQPQNRVRPPVVIRSVTVDGRKIAAPKDLVLPKGARSLQIDYTALSYIVPERVRFRYKLEGVDRDWVDPGLRRQAFYTNLRPGKYVFRVKASNNDGVWNEDGARLDFRLPPTFLQSKLFLALCGLGAAALAWLAYRVRLRQVSERIQMRLQERLAERERIARELHDTLLQGVQGLVLKFQSASDDVPADTPARQSLDRALDRADEMMVEARERVRSLRAVSTGDLATTLADVAQRMDPEGRVETRVVTEGAPLDLHPVAADEIERIVTEALFNAHSHANADAVTIEIVYDPRQLSVRVRDDGVGIEQTVLDSGGREGHFGLAGMRERASKVGGQLGIRSRPGAGAEVEVVIPASSAYQSGRRAWLASWSKSLVE